MRNTHVPDRPLARRQHQPGTRCTWSASSTRRRCAAGRRPAGLPAQADGPPRQAPGRARGPRPTRPAGTTPARRRGSQPRHRAVHGYGAYSAAVAEVAMRPDGKGRRAPARARAELRARVNPSQVAAQVEARSPTACRRRSTASAASIAAGSPRQLRPLRAAAAGAHARSRDGDRAGLRLLGRRGRTDDLRGGAGGDETRSTQPPARRCAACRCAS